MQAHGGIMSITGIEGGEPVRVGCSIVDQGAGMWAAMGILAALNNRHVTGEGCHVSTSLFETAIGWMGAQIGAYLSGGAMRRPMGSGVTEIVPHQAFPTSDGYIMVAAGNDNLFRALCGAIEQDFAADPRFATNSKRVENRRTLIPMLEEIFRARPSAEWQSRLDAAGVPAAPIENVAQVVASPQTAALGMLQKAPDLDMTLAGLPLEFDGVRPPYRTLRADARPAQRSPFRTACSEEGRVMKDLKYETLVLEEPGEHVLTVRINRPEVRNAISTQVGADLHDVFTRLINDTQDYRCVILTGTGDKAFCAGGDLKERNGMTDEQWLKQHALFERMTLSLLDCPIPLIGAVNGAAFGGGCELILTCDFAYASTTARFGLPEITLGIMPGAGGTQFLPRTVGSRRAKEIVLTGRPFSAEQALEWGVVNKLCAPEKLMEETIATAQAIANNAPIATRQAKRSMHYGMQMDLRSALFFEIDVYNKMVTARRTGSRACAPSTRSASRTSRDAELFNTSGSDTWPRHRLPPSATASRTLCRHWSITRMTSSMATCGSGRACQSATAA